MSLCKMDLFSKRLLKKTKCMLQKTKTFQRKLISKVLYRHSTNRNFISLTEGTISFNALILWNKHISNAVNFNRQIPTTILLK